VSLELREPPRPPAAPPRAGAAVWLLAANLVLVATVGALVWWRTAPGRAGSPGGGDREVAAKLQAAGALDEAAALYESVLAGSGAGAGEPAEARAKIAYSLGAHYLDAGRYEKALRWFYQAEALGPGALADDLDRKIVAALERLGRPRAARAALDARVRLEDPAGEAVQRAGDDPVVAQIGEREIRRSEVDRAIDDLPPEAARALAGGSPDDLLRRYVADELVWRKAEKLGYDRDPDVLRRREAVAKQLAVARFLDREVVGKIAADEVDLRSWFTANQERYRRAAGASAGEVTFEKARPLVEREVRLAKAQEAYQKLIDAELAGDDVRLFPERMGGAGSGPAGPGAAGGGAPGAAPAAPSVPAPGAAPASGTGDGGGGGSR
jgi:tetratricopeptide (TPR) repeat protein